MLADSFLNVCVCVCCHGWYSMHAKTDDIRKETERRTDDEKWKKALRGPWALRHYMYMDSVQKRSGISVEDLG